MVFFVFPGHILVYTAAVLSLAISFGYGILGNSMELTLLMERRREFSSGIG